MTDVNDTNILKSDARGRLRYTAEQRQSMLAAFRQSGMSAPRFAAAHGVNYQTLVSWIKKDARGPSTGTQGLPAVLTIVPAEIDAPDPRAAGAALEVQLAGGARIFVTSPDQAVLVAALLRELHPARSC